MKKYRIAKDQKLEIGKEIKLEKVTTAEEITERLAYILSGFFTALFIFNLIRFIF